MLERKDRIDLGTHKLNTRMDGRGEDWIILSNSLGADLTMWDEQIDLLTQKYHVLRYDTRGHGGSDTVGGATTFADLNADVIALMDALEIEKAAFMGLSMGGMTGMGLAVDHADRITRVVCADGRADAPPPFKEMWDGRIAAVEQGGLEAIVEGTLASWFTEDWRNANTERLAQVREMVLSNDPQGYIACCHALKELDCLRRLPEAKAPILFVGGDQDMGAAPAVMQEMADATPGGVYKQVPHAAHVANINAPEAFNAAIAEFLGL
ncbi:3-oxoadipate enol-lactonase [Gymnodinialimonas ceratoperidinii]|uniref:3-oxoadipate enol-lactonase n=1 Tax=Gymnodinialimonas ceratoperidinii TaxID=2856823 RepID=A0A8F6U0F0_9RHOB|nr:3-oxoadipate enol-lactonase [Gymnodinialimonas ceratoperidinii]QXT41087.1 3-oxoadipate enol-lactonase [Gymnodinialimonas ceratoperidinii]